MQQVMLVDFSPSCWGSANDGGFRVFDNQCAKKMPAAVVGCDVLSCDNKFHVSKTLVTEYAITDSTLTVKTRT